VAVPIWTLNIPCHHHVRLAATRHPAHQPTSNLFPGFTMIERGRLENDKTRGVDLGSGKIQPFGRMVSHKELDVGSGKLFGLHLQLKTRVLSTYLQLKINLLPSRAMKCVVHRGSLATHPHRAINCPLYGAYTFCAVCLCELRSSWCLSYAAMNYPDPLILHCKLHSLSRPISHVNVTPYFLIISCYLISSLTPYTHHQCPL
jgi:hypothetical protein